MADSSVGLSLLFRKYVRTRYNGMELPSEFSTLLFGLTFDVAPERPRIRKNAADYFNGVLTLNAWGRPVVTPPGIILPRS